MAIMFQIVGRGNIMTCEDKLAHASVSQFNLYFNTSNDSLLYSISSPPLDGVII